jgi:hypothetical protein
MFFQTMDPGGGNRQFAVGFPSMSISIGENSSKTGPVPLPGF